MSADTLGERGAALLRDIETLLPSMTAPQRVLAVEACRLADRLERMDAVLRGDDDTWMRLKPRRDDDTELEVVIDHAVSEARQASLALERLLGALNLPKSAPVAKGDELAELRSRGRARSRRPSGKAASAVGDDT